MLDVRQRSTFTYRHLMILHTGAILLLALRTVRVLVARCLCKISLWNIAVIRTWRDAVLLLIPSQLTQSTCCALSMARPECTGCGCWCIHKRRFTPTAGKAFSSDPRCFWGKRLGSKRCVLPTFLICVYQRPYWISVIPDNAKML